MEQYHGVFTALMTPFHKGRVDDEGLRELVENQIKRGVNGIVACGTASDTLLDEEECRTVMRICVEQACGRVPVVAGMGGNSVPVVVGRVREARRVGVDAVLCVTPCYTKPTQEGLYRFFRAVCEDASLPMLLHNVPARTGCTLQPTTVARIARDVPDVFGIKEASSDMQRFSDLLAECPEGFRIFSGDDLCALPHMALGGCGVISVTANIAPGMMSTFCRAVFEGNMDKARSLHLRLLHLYKAMQVPLTSVDPIPSKDVRGPLLVLPHESRLPRPPRAFRLIA